MNWTKGRIPIKEGYINLYLVKEGKCTVEIPKGCIIHLYTGQKTKPLILEKAGKYTFTLHSESKIRE